MERKVRHVYTPPPKEEQEEEHVCEFVDGVCFCGAWAPQISIREQISRDMDRIVIAGIEDELAEPDEVRAMTLAEKLIDLGIDPEALKHFCRVATIVPKPMPVDPWESYDAVHTSAQDFVQELKRCGAKSYHIRQALEGAMSNLEGDEDGERRANYEGASKEAEEAKDQQSAIAGSNVEGQKEETQDQEEA